MKNLNLWNEFFTTGKIEDYLKYLQVERENKAGYDNVSDKDKGIDN